MQNFNEEFIEIIQNIFNDKWKLTILFKLYNGKKRFKELSKVLNITDKTLSLKLKELEDKQLIKREHFLEKPPRVEYSLDVYGETLKPTLKSFINWCEVYQKGENNNDKQII